MLFKQLLPFTIRAVLGSAGRAEWLAKPSGDSCVLLSLSRMAPMARGRGHFPGALQRLQYIAFGSPSSCAT